jgi:hypothetical protein
MEKENERRRFSQAALLDSAVHALSQLTTSPDPRVRTLVLQAIGDIKQVLRHTPSRRKNDFRVR